LKQAQGSIMAEGKVTKADIIDAIYQKKGISRKDIKTVVDSFLDEIKNSLIANQIIELRGFGTFEIRIRKGRQKARNPKTGDPVSVNSHGVALFRSGKELKQDVWNINSPNSTSDTSHDSSKT
jgi:integration host factor subunit beta